MQERLDAFMARAIAAYYATHNPFADFTTSPEVSQMFGELLGAWAAETWHTMGRPHPVLLAEIGPGRGTLMADATRQIARIAPDFAAAAQIHFIETSPRLREIQRGRVPYATWHDDIATLPPGPMILFANEFLDALPIRQFVHRNATWNERYVAGENFVLVPCELPGPPPVEAMFEGILVERCEQGVAWTARLAARLAAQGGAALIIDYGPSRPTALNTLQALRGGKGANPLADPGSADITAHVDFPAIAEAARAGGCATWGAIEQGTFLTRLGIAQRLQALQAANPADHDKLNNAADRLVAPARMGQLFKVLAVTSPGLPCPPGLDA